jgi:hypothetical protein
MKEGMRSTLVIATYALLALLVVPVYPHFPSPNEFTRWLQVASAVDYGSLEVSPALPILGSRIEDLSLVDGRIYSNKAPGLALIAIPGYLMARPFSGAPSRANLRPVLYSMRLWGATLPMVLLMLVFRSTARRLGFSDGVIARALLALAFATPLFAYGLLLFSHVLVACCLFAAWALLYVAPPQKSRWRAPGAGALIGLAVMSEYPAAIPGAILIAPLLTQRRFGALGSVLMGASPFAVLLGIYHALAFGSPFRLPGQFELFPQFRELAARGILGIQWPAPSRLAGLLFDGSKGLLVFSPILLMGLFWLRAGARQLSREALFSLIAVPASIVLIYAGYPNWHGGWTVGARYIAAAVPFLAFPLLFREWTPLARWLCGWSVTAVALTTLVFPFVPPSFPLPWGSFAMPLLRHGLVIPNWFHWIAAPLAVSVPFALVAAAVASSFLRTQIFEVLGGVVFAIVLGIASIQWVATDRHALQRAYIEEVYFEQPGAISRTARGRAVSPRLLARRAAELAQPPGSWPF